MLRTETNTKENNYLKLLNNKANTKIKEKINKIRILLTKLGNIVTTEESNSIRKKLHELEKQTKFPRRQREEAHRYLSDLIVYLNKKVKYRFTDFHDQTFFGIGDIEKLYEYFDDNSEYYKPMLIASSFHNNYTEYEIRDDKNKNLSLKQYIFKITPQLIDLINEKMNSTKDEQKIQLLEIEISTEITYNPERISKLLPSIDNYNRKDIQFHTTKKDWTAFEKNTQTLHLTFYLHRQQKRKYTQ